MHKHPLAVIFLTVCPLVLAQQPQATSVTAQAATASSSAVPAKPSTLLDGTPIKLRIGRNVSSADAKVGDHVDFEVLDEIQVMGVVVIAKGATASATVTAAEPKKRLGRAGNLEMTLDYVRLVDNEKAALTATAGGKGASHVGAMTGAIVATAIFTLGGSALFLFMHGKDITIPKGAETTAYVSGDMPLDMAKFLPTSAPNAMSSTAAAPGLTIEANVPNCDIEVDGSFVGSTPTSINIPPGKHEIAVKKTGYQDWTRSMMVGTGSIRISAEMIAK